MKSTDSYQLKASEINLASYKLGARVVEASDDFFAPKERLILDSEPVFKPGVYDENGKWMDGWESRRKRSSGNDYAIIQLATSGSLEVVLLDTSHFNGNQPEYISLEATADDQLSDTTKWVQVIDKSEVAADSRHYFAIQNHQNFRFVRLQIYPDGGVARLRVFGRPVFHWQEQQSYGNKYIELSASIHGAYALSCSNQHFGSVQNLLAPARGINMGDGWETRRSRRQGNDWAIIALAHAGILNKICLDTCHFKGNYPDMASLEGIYAPDASQEELEASSLWISILPKTKLAMDKEHSFEKVRISPHSKISHVRLNIFPDGGVSRLKLFGEIS